MPKVPIKDLLELPVSERIQLIQDLWDSVAADPANVPVTDAQRKELRLRLAEHRSDPDSAVPWEEVRRRLYERYG
jgi:putative addiction module component (TIGR02574 family)